MVALKLPRNKRVQIQMSEPMTGLPPEKFVCLHPVGKELQLERVGLTASRQVVVELREEIILSFLVLFTWGMKLLMK